MKTPTPSLLLAGAIVLMAACACGQTPAPQPADTPGKPGAAAPPPKVPTVPALPAFPTNAPATRRPVRTFPTPPTPGLPAPAGAPSGLTNKPAAIPAAAPTAPVIAVPTPGAPPALPVAGATVAATNAPPPNVVGTGAASAATNAPIQPRATIPAPPTIPSAAVVAPPTPGPARPGPAGAVPATSSVTGLLGVTNTFSVATNAPGAEAEAPITISWPSLPLEQVLANYSELTERTVLRPNQLPNVSVTLITKKGLSKAEAIQAIDSVLTLNGITMINVGEKFVTAVQSQQAIQEGAAFSSIASTNLPEAGQYVTKIVQLKHARPQEVQPIIQGFGKVQNGVVAIESTQTLVLRDYAANIKRMMELIEKLDVETETDYKLEVIPIKYGKVEEIYSTMSSLIGGGGGGYTGGARATSGARVAGTRGGTRGRQTGLGGMGQRGVTGQMQTQQFQQQPGQVPGQTSFQQRLSQIASRAGGAGTVELLGDARIVPDERSNSLIVFASKEDMQMITNIVSKVDRLLAQVLIEAVIMSVDLNNKQELGVSATMNPRQTGKLTSSASSVGTLSTNLDLTSLAGGGFGYLGKWAGDLQVAVKAVASDGKTHILQTPRVQTSHAIPASFFAGQTVPYINSTYYGGYSSYGPSASYQQMEVGVGLNVTPYITPDGLVVMDIQQTIEDLGDDVDIPGGGKVPKTIRREAAATVSVQDGDTIILGGYIRTKADKSKSGVPLLKDIPLLGALFRSKSEGKERSELIVLLRPTVLKTPHDAAILARNEQDRLPGVREMEKQMADEEQVRQQKADKATGRKRKP